MAVLVRPPTLRPCSRWIAHWRSSNCCCAPAPLTVREVAVGTSINRTTAHRLLASLHRRGWIERVADSAAYRPGLRYLALVRASLSGRDFVDEVRPTMERLSLLSRETVHLGVLDNHDVLHIEKVDSPEIVGVSSRVGTRAAPHVTGLGKALLASGPDEELEAYIDHAGKRSLPPSRLRSRGISCRDRAGAAGDTASTMGSHHPVCAAWP